MSLSLILAQIIGITLVLVWISILINVPAFKKVIAEYMKNTGVVYVSAIFTMIFGIILVLIHNVWIRSREVIVTILAWMTLIKGASLLFAPQQFGKLVTYIRKNTTMIIIEGIIMILLGLFLIGKGFMLF